MQKRQRVEGKRNTCPFAGEHAGEEHEEYLMTQDGLLEFDTVIYQEHVYTPKSR